jgi:hypothetical protein
MFVNGTLNVSEFSLVDEMDSDRTPHKILNYKPPGVRNVGRPKKR